jgi:putative membrane protein
MQVRRSTTVLERVLLVAAGIIWVIGGIAPLDRAAWVLENILLVVGVAWVIVTYRKWHMTQLSYALIFLFFVLHVLGAHYTYASTPLGQWLQIVTGADRNHYDRVVHFLFGFLLIFPLRDQMQRAMHVTTGAAWLIGFLFVTSLSGLYEVMEWVTAALVSPDDAIGFLGTQGDVFDSQKDMALASIGAALGWSLACFGKLLCRQATAAKQLMFSLFDQGS